MNPFNRLVQAAQDACLTKVKRQRQEPSHEPLTMWTTVSKHNNSSANSSAASLAAPAHKTAAADLLALLGKGSQGSALTGGQQPPGQQQHQRPLSGNATAQTAQAVLLPLLAIQGVTIHAHLLGLLQAGEAKVHVGKVEMSCEGEGVVARAAACIPDSTGCCLPHGVGCSMAHASVVQALFLF